MRIQAIALASLTILSGCQLGGRSAPVTLRGQGNSPSSADAPATVRSEWGERRADQPVVQRNDQRRAKSAEPEAANTGPSLPVVKADEPSPSRVDPQTSTVHVQRSEQKTRAVKEEGSASQSAPQPESREKPQPKQHQVVEAPSTSSDTQAQEGLIEDAPLPPNELDDEVRLTVPEASELAWLKITGNVSTLKALGEPLSGPAIYYDLWIVREGTQSEQGEFVEFMQSSGGEQHLRRKLATLMHSFSESEISNLNFPAAFEEAAHKMIEEETGEPIGVVAIKCIQIEKQ